MSHTSIFKKNFFYYRKCCMPGFVQKICLFSRTRVHTSRHSHRRCDHQCLLVLPNRMMAQSSTNAGWSNGWDTTGRQWHVAPKCETESRTAAPLLTGLGRLFLGVTVAFQQLLLTNIGRGSGKSIFVRVHPRPVATYYVVTIFVERK